MHGAFKMRKDHLFEEHCRYARQHSQCRAQLGLKWGGKKTLKKAEIVVLVLNSEQASQGAQGSVCVAGPWVFGRLGTYRTKCKSVNSCITPPVFMEQHNMAGTAAGRWAASANKMEISTWWSRCSSWGRQTVNNKVIPK